MSRLPLTFFQRPDTATLARELIGKWLFSQIAGEKVGGIISETEAYLGGEDRACHAYGYRRTPRTEVMFRRGGCAYVYLCYGMHHLLNLVTHLEGMPHAILLRGLVPMEGVETIQRRRKGKSPLAQGPGTLCQALGVDLSHNGLPLQGDLLWVEDREEKIEDSWIHTSPRIGVEYAGSPDALLPLRFFLGNFSGKVRTKISMS
jgi:DNA-3-methyladenine glycosylase